MDTGDLALTNWLYALNDYNEEVTFGSTLSFQVAFNLPDILMGNSGGELDVQLTTLSPGYTPLLTGDPSGNIVEIAYDYTGAFTPTATSSDATVTPAGGVPEPGSWALTLIGAGLAGGMRMARRREPALRL